MKSGRIEPKKVGQLTAESMAADFNGFMKFRFDSTAANFLRVFSECLDKAALVEGKDAPPLMHASVQYESFLGYVAESRPKMLAEVQEAMREHLQIASQLGVADETWAMISDRIDLFLSDLRSAGHSLMLGYADRLNEADDRWRAENVELASNFPPERPLANEVAKQATTGSSFWGPNAASFFFQFAVGLGVMFVLGWLFRTAGINAFIERAVHSLF